MSLADTIEQIFAGEIFTMQDIYKAIPDKPKTTIRARVYDNLDKRFVKLNKGVYTTKIGNNECIVIEGNGRDLSFLENESIDCILTDHPWEDKKSNIGGDRKFVNYDCFKYEQSDFDEKYRVLRKGRFLVEIVPSENENNFRYLYKLKELAIKSGFEYYAKVTWTKGTFVSNTGRKAKNSEDIMIFSKGKARKMRVDAKKTKQLGEITYMSGTNGMLPTHFNAQAVSVSKRVHKAEKPVELLMDILEYVTYPGEVILDQFAGSGSLGIAALKKNRGAILIELLKENVEKITERLNKLSQDVILNY